MRAKHASYRAWVECVVSRTDRPVRPLIAFAEFVQNAQTRAPTRYKTVNPRASPLQRRQPALGAMDAHRPGNVTPRCHVPWPPME